MSDSGNGTPPGWYPDGQGGQRWWDGTQWAAPTAPPAGAPTGPPPSGPPPSGPPPGAAPFGAPPETGATPYGTQAMPQQGYPGGPGQPGAPAGSAKSRTGLYAGIGLGAAALIILLLTAFVVPGFLVGSSGPSSSDPAATVRAFIDAGKDQDCDAVQDLVTDKLKGDIAGNDCGSADLQQAEDLGIDPQDITYEVGEATIDGDTASVPVTLQLDSAASGALGALGVDDLTLNYLLVKEGGDWLIDDFKADLSSVLPDGLPSDPSTDTSTDVPTDPSTDDPTDFPSDLFSDLPTDLPTDLFSDLPSDFPSDLFSDLPSDLFSDFPSDLFSDLPSDFPSDLFSDLPTS